MSEARSRPGTAISVCGNGRGSIATLTPSGWRKTILDPEHEVRSQEITDPVIVHLMPNVRDGQAFWRVRDALASPAGFKEYTEMAHAHATHIVAAIYAGIDLQAMST